jgi:drug/metabolite transporter (DMT)-like permease
MTSTPARAGLLLACFFWAISFIATKIALQSVPPITVVTLRLLFSALCFLPLLYRRRAAIRISGAGEWAGLIAFSLIGSSLHYGIQTAGIQYTTASNASLWAMTCPVSITLIAALFLHERVTLKKVLGILLAVGGVCVVLGPDFFRGVEFRSHLLGDGLVFLSIFMWAVFTVCGKRLSADTGALELIAMAMVIGSVTMIPACLWEIRGTGFSFAQITWQAWAAVAFLGVTCGFLANLLYFLALEKMESQKVGVYLYLIPPMTYVAAVFMLNETIGTGLIAGSALVMAGVYLTERG